MNGFVSKYPIGQRRCSGYLPHDCPFRQFVVDDRFLAMAWISQSDLLIIHRDIFHV
jgi:hypothetical protein